MEVVNSPDDLWTSNFVIGILILLVSPPPTRMLIIRQLDMLLSLCCIIIPFLQRTYQVELYF